MQRHSAGPRAKARQTNWRTLSWRWAFIARIIAQILGQQKIPHSQRR
jgi:hypothetical protein